VTVQHETRAPFVAQTTKTDKRCAGRTEASETPLELRTLDRELDSALRDWIYQRTSRQLGKYAPYIERIQVRFGDENGANKGGADKVCVVHLVLSKLPPVVVEARGETEREAFDRAVGRAERATRHNVQRHGFHTHSAQRERQGSLDAPRQDNSPVAPLAPAASPPEAAPITSKPMPT
jgi:hypothetical protein